VKRGSKVSASPVPASVKVSVAAAPFRFSV
jgi:hypothetical protein